ncbi:hypothetical protein RB195_024555 [Necator americanus]|uniref:Uncharacterized protein n=1 Tax=Necator americanus TaxID=51031 RepID=A0ABR1ENM9_NECAM
MKSSATTIRFVTMNYPTLSTDFQQAACLGHYDISMCRLPAGNRHQRPAVISTGGITIFCCDVDEKQIEGCAVVAKSDNNNLVDEFA